MRASFLLPGLCLLLLAATAPATEERGLNPAPVYRDLPGVKAPEDAQVIDGFTCTTVLRSYRDDNWRHGFSRTLPRRVYRCEKDGVAFESPDPPRRGTWMPGINPPDARPR